MSVAEFAAPLATLREALRAAGFTAARIREASYLSERVSHARLRVAVGLLQLQETGDAPFAALARMFTFGEAAARSELQALFPGLDLEGLASAELIDVRDDSVVPRVRMTEFGGLFFAHDDELERRSDCVVGVSHSTRISTAYTPRRDVARALDVGTGCGTHALLAARHAGHVVATDINPRALRFTALNASLNEIANVETREGSFLEPVLGERFDLIVANPPYVISPDSDFLYRDCSVDGDGLCRMLLAALPEHLEEGGFATLQGNWLHDASSPWWSAIEEGLRDGGCDGYVLRGRSQDPLAYAVGWLSRPEPGDPDGGAERIRRWRESYRAAAIEAITTAVVILRRREGDNWFFAVTEQSPPHQAIGRTLATLFAAQDEFAALDPDALAAAPAARAGPARRAAHDRGRGRDVVAGERDRARDALVFDATDGPPDQGARW